jgi:hypothetical protein
VKKIVVGGHLEKEKIAEMIKEIGKDQVSVEIKSDLEAAMAVKNNQADYYFGACNTGGGGALAMAIAMLGMNQCVSVSTPGMMLSDEKILQSVKDGKKAFGFTPQHAEQVIPVILNAILNG